MADTKLRPQDLDTEAAPRQIDPFESNYLGVLRTNDPLLLEKGQNVEIYRDLKRDGKVKSKLQQRIGALVSREWTVTPIDETKAADAETLTKILKGINFDQLCRDLLDALIMGYSIAEIIWTVSDGLVVPKKLIKRRQRRFVYVDTEAGPQLRLLTQENMLTGVELPEKKFIVHRVDPEDDNPYGTGLGLQLYWPVFFKRKGIISWNKLNDRFGAPTPWGKYPKNATPKEKATLFDALKAISNDGVVMTPDGMALELLESKLTGSITTQQALCEYMDDWIAEVVLGQEPRTKGGGALAAASKERSAVRLDLVQADSDLLSETLNSSLIAWLCEYNGLAACRVYREIAEEEDKKAESETDKNVSEMGFELSEDAVREKYGEGWSKKETPPQSPVLANAAVDTRKSLVPGQPASFAEAGGNAQPGDAIDALIAAEADQWQPLLDPMINPLEALLADAKKKGETAEQLLARLPEVIAKMDTTALAEALTKMCFTARVAGVVGVDSEQVQGD